MILKMLSSIKTSNHSDPHHPSTECCALYEKGSDSDGNDNNKLQSPEAVLNRCASVAR